MSGHSKWANIKRKKEANDKVKGAIFAKHSRLITLAVIEGGGIPDPIHNFKLRLAVDKAKSLNMPKDNIARAIEKATGAGKTSLKEVIYEGFAPHKVAILMQSTTDNPNRTVSEIKNILERHGGKLGSQGSVSYLFEKCGYVEIHKKDNSEDEVYQFAEVLKSLDIEEDEVSYHIYVPFDMLGKVKQYGDKITIKSTEIDYKPHISVSLPDVHQIRAILSLTELLESLDDVHKVFTNLDIPDNFE